MPASGIKRAPPRSTRADLLLGLEAPAPSWPYLPVACLFAAGWLLFAWPWLSGSVTIPWDAKAQFAPQVQFLAASIARGMSPFWAPYNFAGHPQVADPQSLIFSPPFLILALLDAAPSLRALDATVLACVLASGLAVLWLARDLGWHWAGAVIAALGFCFGAAMAWRLQHFGQVLSLGYLPFALVFLKRGLERGSAGYGLAAGIVAAFITLGRDQVGLLCLYVLAGYVAWHMATAETPGAAIRRGIRPLLAGGIGGAALVAIPLILTLLLAGQSNRPAIDYPGAAAGSLHPGLFVTAIIPHLFGAAGEMEKYWGPPSFTWEGTGLYIAQNVGQLYLGAIPVLLLIAGLMRGLLWEREIRFYTVVTIAVTLYALGGYTPAFRVHVRAAARREAVPPAGRRGVPGRRFREPAGRLCRPPVPHLVAAGGEAVAARRRGWNRRRRVPVRDRRRRRLRPGRPRARADGDRGRLDGGRGGSISLPPTP